MAKSPYFKDVQLMTSAVVAIVAFAGLAMVYSDNTVPAGATVSGYQLMPNAVDAGKRCGECAKSYGDTNTWDFKKCPLMPGLNSRFGLYSTKLTEDCCKNECENMADNLHQDYYTRHCGQVCKGAADCTFGYCQYAGGYTE